MQELYTSELGLYSNHFPVLLELSAFSSSRNLHSFTLGHQHIIPIIQLNKPDRMNTKKHKKFKTVGTQGCAQKGSVYCTWYMLDVIFYVM